jgi:hypothetical protein
MKLEYKILLKPKGVLLGEEPQIGDDQFLQCQQCGKVIPIYEAKHEQTLEGFAQPSDNPFDTGEEITGVPKRNTPLGKKATEKRKRQRTRPTHKDAEIDEALGRFGEENVSIIEDTDPDPI